MQKSTTVQVFETAEDVARAGAEKFVTLANDAIADRGAFSVALAGGNTPRLMYQLLAGDPFRSRIDWSLVQLFFGDERRVPHNHPDSNYRMADEALISRVDIPSSNVHAIIGEGDPTENARLYEDDLRSFFSGFPSPRFDLVLLGLGEDGHTASLFPHTSALKEKRAWVVAIWVEALRTYRITLSPPVINSAAHVMFMVTGAEKAPALAEILNGATDPERLPAQLIKPEAGALTWLADFEAASQLPETFRSSAVNVTEQPENNNKDQNC
jgi:6-phosphogluconolactonase